MIIDTHCHVGAVWYEPAETLLFQMDRCGVQQAVLIQMLGQFDNSYQQACVNRWPDRFSSVVAVDPGRPDALDVLARLVDGGAVGLRLRPTARSPGEDPLLIWRTAEQNGLVVSCVGTTAQFTAPGFAELVSALPSLPIVLEHLGGIARPDVDDTAPQVFDLAGFPNLYLKVPGLGQLLKRMPLLPSEGLPFESMDLTMLEQAVKAFSAPRLMWGSDFPVVGQREGYASALNWVMDALAFLQPQDRFEVFGGVAARVFGRAKIG